MNDLLSDMLARIKNAYLAGKEEVVLPHTRLLAEVARVLVATHYLESAHTESKPRPELRLTLKYIDSQPVLKQVRRVSKPGVRHYTKARDIKPVLSGLGLSIVSTSRGIMTGQQARKNKLGGEVLLELW